MSPSAGDEHAAIRRHTLLPPTAADLLTRVLKRESASRSATHEQCGLSDPVSRLRDAVVRYTDSVGLAPVLPGKPAVRAAPLPWLSPVPACRDDAWQTYLTARAVQVSELADDITRLVAAHTRSDRDPLYQRDVVLWRATHAAGSGTGELTSREAAYLRHLQGRKHDLAAPYPRVPRDRWLALVAAVDPGAAQTPEWLAMASSLSKAFDAGLDVDRLLPELLAGRRYLDALANLDRLVQHARCDNSVRARPALARQLDRIGHEPPAMRHDLEL